MSFDYWTFGNAAVVIQLFNMVAALVAPASGMVGAAKVMAVLAFMTVVTGAALRADPKPVFQWFIGLTIGWFVLFAPKVTMLVIDKGPSGTETTVAVADVPLGLGFVASSASKFSRWLTNVAESTLSLPDAVAFTNTGMFTPQRLILNTRDYSMRASTLEADWNQFFYNCTWYDINVYGGRLGLAGFPTNDELANTADPMSVLGKTNKKLFVTLVTGGEATYTCDEAYTVLKTQTEDLANGTAMKSYYARAAFPSYPVADAVTAYDSAMSSATQLMFGAPIAASTVIKNQWLVNLLRDYDGNAAAATQNPADAMADLMATQNFNQRISAYLQSARAAQDTIPMLRNIMEAIAIGLFPVVILMMILMGLMGLRLLAEWAMFFLSLQLWGFCYALLNFVVVSKTSSNIYSMASNVDGLSTGVTTGFFSLANSNGLTEEITADMAMAGSVAWAIPIICYGLVRGLGSAGMAMASSVTSAGKMSAETSGQKAGVGDYGMGTARFDEVRAPGTQSVGNSAGMSTSVGGRQVAFDGWQSSAAASVSSNLTNSAALQVAASRSEQLGQQQATAADNVQQAVVSQAVTSALKASNISAIDQQWQQQGSGSFERGHSATENLVRDVQASTGATEQVATRMVVRGGLGVNASAGGAGQRLTGNIGADIQKTYGSDAAARFNSSQSSSNQTQSSEAAKFVQTLSSSESARSSVSGGSEQSKAWSSNLSAAQSLRESSSANLQKAQGLSELSTQAMNSSANLGFDVVKANPEIAQAVSQVVQSPEFKALGQEGNVMGQRAMVVDALSTKGIDMDSLKGLSQNPEGATVAAPAQMPDGAAAPSDLSTQYSAASAQLQTAGGQAVSQHFQEGTPSVSVGGPDTAGLQGSVSDGQAGIRASVDRGSAAVTSQRRELSTEVAPQLPTRDHNALDVPQSQVATVGRIAGNDAMNTVNNVSDAAKGVVKSDIPPENPDKPIEARGP